MKSRLLFTCQITACCNADLCSTLKVYLARTVALVLSVLLFLCFFFRQRQSVSHIVQRKNRRKYPRGLLILYRPWKFSYSKVISLTVCSVLRSLVWWAFSLFNVASWEVIFTNFSWLEKPTYAAAWFIRMLNLTISPRPRRWIREIRRNLWKWLSQQSFDHC